MRYVQLRAFHYVAICGGFSRAADALFLTQPAISDQVRKLEEEYDVLLFNRHKKQVLLTEQGKKLLEITNRMFDNEQQALDMLSESRALRSGHLRIVADAAHHLLHILGRFREKYPGIHVTVHAGNTETVISSLFAYEADLGVLGEIPQGARIRDPEAQFDTDHRLRVGIARAVRPPIDAIGGTGETPAGAARARLEDPPEAGRHGPLA